MNSSNELNLLNFFSNGQLSVRAYNVLEAIKITTLTELATFINTENSFLKIRNCGIKTQHDILEFYKDNSHLLQPIVQIEQNSKIEEKKNIEFTALDEFRFKSYLESEFISLSTRTQNAFLPLFNNTFPNISDFLNLFTSSYSYRDLRNIGEKSSTELRNFVRNIKRFIESSLAKQLTKIEETSFRISELTGLYIEDLLIIEAFQNRCLNIIEFIKTYLRQILKLNISEEYVLRHKLGLHIDKDLKSKLGVTKERIRQIAISALDDASENIYLLGKSLIEYTTLDEAIQKSDIIDIETFNWEKYKIEKTISNNTRFATFVLSNVYKDSLYSLSNLNKIKRPKIIQNYDLYNSNKEIKGFYLVNNKLLSKDLFLELYHELLSKICRRQEKDKLFSLEKYYSKTEQSNYQLFFAAISYLLIKELKGIKIDNDLIVIQRNTPKVIYEYALEALIEIGKPAHISIIYKHVIKRHEDFETSEDSLKTSMARNKNLFIYFGRSSTYGLKIWETQFDHIKGGTIRDIVEDFLTQSDRPGHISDVTDYVKKYRKTNDYSVMSNLKLEGGKRFKFFKGGYIGLASKNYSGKKLNNYEFQEISLDELLLNIFS